MGIITHRGHRFRIVDEVPCSYAIWPIGENMMEGYLPFCRLSAHQPFPGGRSIEVDTLLAVPCEEAYTIMSCAVHGIGTVEKMEKYIKRYRNAKPGTVSHSMVQKCKVALPHLRKVKWR